MATPRVDFYHNVPDRLLVAVKLAHKSFASRQPLVVVAPDERIAQAFDRQLWSLPALSFTPHCRADSPLAGETPVLIARRLDELPPGLGTPLLLNLGAAVPEGYERFERILEIIGQDEAERLPGRERVGHYKQAGCAVSFHDLGQRAH